MATLGFIRRDFDVFAIEDFSARMAKIDEFVTPRLTRLALEFNRELSRNLGVDFFPHIARHMRRAASPPDETWAAFGPSRAGYKRYGYFALCISGAGIHARAVVKPDADKRCEIGRLIKSKSADLEKSFRGTRIQQYQNWDCRKLPDSTRSRRRLLRRTRRHARDKNRRHRPRLRMARARRAERRSRRDTRRVPRTRTALPRDPLGRVTLTNPERTITRLAYSCLLMVGINSGWIGPFIPQISHTAHLPIERAGLIVSASAAGYLISVLIAGEINQQLSAQKILVGAMVLFTAGLTGLAMAPGLAGLLCAGFLNGVANGGIDIGANALIVELNRERLASALNYLHVLFGIGALLGPLIVSAAFATRLPYWWVFGGGAMACAAIGFGMGVTPAIEVRTSPAFGDKDSNGFITMLSRPLIWAISGVMFLYVGAEIGIGAWLFLYLRMAGALGPMLASSGVSLYWTGLVCGRAFGGRLGHRIALPQFTMLASSLSAAALLILIVAPTSGVLAASAIFLIGVGYGPVFPNMIAVGAAQFPAEVGRMTSIVVAGGALGSIIAPWVMGHAIANISPRASMEVALVFTVAMAALALSLRTLDLA